MVSLPPPALVEQPPALPRPGVQAREASVVSSW
jgi:hypothetical protein